MISNSQLEYHTSLGHSFVIAHTRIGKISVGEHYFFPAQAADSRSLDSDILDSSQIIPDDDKITVLEINQDVIDLIGPSLPTGKTTIVRGDYITHDLPDANGCLFDLFVGRGSELVGHAMQVYLDLRKTYKIVRIHGLNNKFLESMVLGINELTL